MLFIRKSRLKAALTHAADRDIRYYLNGVLLEVTASGSMHMVATDGHRLFAGLVDAPAWQDKPQAGPWSIIIPRDALKTACTGKDETLLLQAMGDGRYMLGNTVFSPVDGKFPDWRRVSAKQTTAEVASQYHWQYLADANEALRLWYDGRKDFSNYAFKSYGENGRGIMHGRDCTAYCVIMPMRADKVDMADYFTPASYE